VYKQILINAELKTAERKDQERSRNRVDWEKSIKEAKVCIGLRCNLKKKKEEEEEAGLSPTQFA
jgi:hypothetical protein